MLSIFKSKKKVYELYSPVNGKSVDLSDVPDKVFANKLMGDGIAFNLEDSLVCAPCDGELTMLTPTRHAFGIKADNGAEILVHIGLDTVNLNGEGFKVIAVQGKRLKKGTPIIEVDLELLKQKGFDLTTPMIVTNGSEFELKIEPVEQQVSIGETLVITINKK